MGAPSQTPKPHQTDQKYIRPIHVVRQTGLSKSAVMAALWAGELQAFRKGRAWLIPVDAVDQWIRGDGFTEDRAASEPEDAGEVAA